MAITLWGIILTSLSLLSLMFIWCEIEEKCTSTNQYPPQAACVKYIFYSILYFMSASLCVCMCMWCACVCGVHVCVCGVCVCVCIVLDVRKEQSCY